MHVSEQDIYDTYSGRDINLRYADAITDFDLNQLRANEFLGTTSNDIYRLFECFNKFSYLAIEKR
jgi:hypothetical protein